MGSAARRPSHRAGAHRGGVQGVGYRYWTERVAGELNLSGWVRNRRDGSVEALFSGPADDVAQMLSAARTARPRRASQR